MLHLGTPSDQRLKDVRAHLVQRGITLAAFCREHRFVRQAVSVALSGQRRGPRAQRLAREFLAKVRTTL
jgi:lambda repressor-like predicted transcriptional regulator